FLVHHFLIVFQLNKSRGGNRNRHHSPPTSDPAFNDAGMTRVPDAGNIDQQMTIVLSNLRSSLSGSLLYLVDGDHLRIIMKTKLRLMISIFRYNIHLLNTS